VAVEGEKETPEERLRDLQMEIRKQVTDHGDTKANGQRHNKFANSK
jgi:hypothetical protein